MRAPRSTSDNRRFPAGPRTTSRPLPGRARSAAPTARKKCTGHMRARVCAGIRAHTCPFHARMSVLERPATETRRDSRHTIADTLTFTLTFTLAAGSRGCIGSRHVGGSRASGPHHTIVARSATARRRGRTTRDDGTTSCRLFVLQFSASSARGSLLQREMPTVRYRRSSSSIASSLSAYVCRAWKLSLSCHRPSSNCRPLRAGGDIPL